PAVKHCHIRIWVNVNVRIGFYALSRGINKIFGALMLSSNLDEQSGDIEMITATKRRINVLTICRTVTSDVTILLHLRNP
ncbi:10878_t:CDS:2, partial [Gigaspora rosea]